MTRRCAGRMSGGGSLLLLAGLGAIVGCGAAAEDSAADVDATGEVAATSSALLPAPSKAEIDAYMRAHGFPDSDYPYYAKTNGCGSDWNVGLIPDQLPAVETVWFQPPPVPIPIPPFFKLPPKLPTCAPGSPTTPIQFTSACNNHDRCYMTKGSSQADCDKNLASDLLSACKTALWTTPLLPCNLSPVPAVGPGSISMILSQPFIKGELNSKLRCDMVAQYYYNAVQLTGGSYHGPSQGLAASYDALVQKFIDDRRYGVCVDGSNGCDRAPQILHRMTVGCSGGLVADESTVDLRNGYRNYRCQNRYQAQCVDDGSADAYYMEWCEYADSRCTNLGAGQYACDPGAVPSAPGCRASKLHRTSYGCDGTQKTQEQIVDLLATGYPNYTCGNRFREQCVADGSWDGYDSEWCEYSCSP